jgi:membrane protease YdiL (CAAX protease family)
MMLGEMHFPSLATGAWRGAQFVALGIAQQYALLGFVFRRLERVAGDGPAIALAALVFALLHLPNVWLTAVTIIWGVIACLVYRRSPNLWANGLAHGVLAALVYFALPRSVTGGLRVGMEYFAS